MKVSFQIRPTYLFIVDPNSWLLRHGCLNCAHGCVCLIVKLFYSPPIKRMQVRDEGSRRKCKCTTRNSNEYYRNSLNMTRVVVCSGSTGWRVIWISGSLIWSKTLMELVFNSCGEFRRSPEGPVSQIHFPRLQVDPLKYFQIFQGLFRYSRESVVQKATGSYRTYLSKVNVQPCFLSLQWKTCLLT